MTWIMYYDYVFVCDLRSDKFIFPVIIFFSFSLQWLSTLFKMKAHSFLDTLIYAANYIWFLRPSGRGILDLSLSLLRAFFTLGYSPKDDLVKENFFKVNHRSPSFSVTGEEELSLSPLSLSQIKLDLSISWLYSNRKNTFSVV